MVNWLYAGIPLGTAVTMVAGGYLLHFFGWPSVFYVAGGLTLVWFVFWSFFVYNDPSEHPRITEEELNYIQSHLEGESMTVLFLSTCRCTYHVQFIYVFALGAALLSINLHHILCSRIILQLRGVKS